MHLLSVLLLATTAFALPQTFDPSPYAGLAGVSKRAANGTASPLVVDLGYSVYRGYVADDTGLRTWRGVRFGQDTRQYRWQPPRVPLTNRSQILDADQYGTLCPQAPNAGSTYAYWDSGLTTEDCLFLNVQAPSNVTNPAGLPVLVAIHGGGYGSGSNNLDFSKLIATNENSFVAVSIQYRLNAFGFLSSDEVHLKGTPNAGLLDQQLALQWVQQYIHLFGGNPMDVTIFGQSAGGGSVMLHDIAYGGGLGSTLFRNSISSSPYLPMQHGYKDWAPSQAYYAFATAAGCATSVAFRHNGSLPIFECLLEKDLQTLIAAATNVSQSGIYYSWAFVPVTDGNLIQQRPSEALAEGRVNGVNHLTGNNALEGAAFVPAGIDTIHDLVSYLKAFFPTFSNNDIAKLLDYYPTGNASTDSAALLWATDGSSDGATTLNQSTAATGQQQRAIAIVGESMLICPSYWLAEAYSDNGRTGGSSWKYQFSIPNAEHGVDTYAYLQDFYTPAFSRAFRRMYGNFIQSSNPSISSATACGTPNPTCNQSAQPVSEWPTYNIGDPLMANLNTTCPEIITLSGLPYCGVEGAAQNRIRLVNAYEWEGGRGERCNFWRMMGEKVPA